MAITRRSFLTGLGSVSVGLLFHKRLDRVLESLERDFVDKRAASELEREFVDEPTTSSLARELVDEPSTPDQLPAAAEIVVTPQWGFRPARLVAQNTIAHLFLIEDIQIGTKPQFSNTAVPADMFTTGSLPDIWLRLDAAAPGMEIRFRVRYVGTDPRGARFQAALFGRSFDTNDWRMLHIDSGCAIAA